MTAVEFSPQERARLDAIEAAQPAPESLRERVARAIWKSDTETEFPDLGATDFDRLWPKVLSHFPADAEAYRRQADAALAALAVIKGDPS